MVKRQQGISVRIFGKDFNVACPEGHEHKLLDAARHLDKKMNEIRDNGRVIGIERIAIMAALNISHEALEEKNSNQTREHELKHKMKRMHDKIEDALFFHTPANEITSLDNH